MEITMKRIACVGLAVVLASAWLAAAAPRAPSAGRTAENDPDSKEMRDYRLSIDNIQKYVAASKALAGDPSAVVCFKNNPPGNAKTFAEGDKIIASYGRAAADISGAGLKPHDFLVMTGASFVMLPPDVNPSARPRIICPASIGSVEGANCWLRARSQTHGRSSVAPTKRIVPRWSVLCKGPAACGITPMAAVSTGKRHAGRPRGSELPSRGQ
jgi:hypothetical protein